MISVLDSSAMIAYLKGEPGSDVVEKILLDPAIDCYAHSVNLCEVYYYYLRIADQQTSRGFIDRLFRDGVTERSDMSRAFWECIGSYKVRGKIALGDCFCLALAQGLQGEVVTSDHAEFDPLIPLGICAITFIR